MDGWMDCGKEGRRESVANKTRNAEMAGGVPAQTDVIEGAWTGRERKRLR